MIRQVYLYSSPLGSLAPWLRPEAQVVLPNRLAARTLGIDTYTTLDGLAEKILAAEQQAIAGPLVTLRLLQDLNTGDSEASNPLGLLPLIREFLETGPVLETLSAQDAPVIAEQIAMAQRYHQALQSEGLVDPAQRFWQASQVVKSPQALLIYGYPTLDKGALTFINTLADEESILFLPALEGDLAPELHESLLFIEELGWTVAPLSPDSSPLPQALLHAFKHAVSPHCDTVQASVHPTLEAEVRSALGDIKIQLLNGEPMSDMAIVSGDFETYQATLEAVAWEYGIPLGITTNTLLKNTLLGSWLTLLSEVLDEYFPYEATLRLLQHPMGPGLTPEQLKQIYGQHPTGKSEWLSQGIEWLMLLDWPQKANRSEWVTTLTGLFDTCETALKITPWPLEQAAFAVFHETLDQWQQAAPDESLSRNGFLHEVTLMLHMMSVLHEGTENAVPVLSPEQVMGAQIPRLYVLGMAEGLLPATPKSMPSLSFQTRNQLVDSGVPIKSLVKLARQESLRFYALLHCPTHTLWLSYSKLIANKAQLPSPYFDLLGVQPQTSRTVPPCSLEEGRRAWLFETDWKAIDPASSAIRKALAVENDRELSPAQNDYDGVTGIPINWETHTFTATQLLSVGQCPFRWWAGYALKLASPEESDEALSPSIKGSFYHKVLELAFKKDLGSENLAEAVPTHLDAAFNEAERQLRMPIAIPSWKIMRLEHLDKLGKLVNMPDLYGEVQQVLGLEQEFDGVWHGLQVRGKVDRVDLTPKGAVVIDYKTSGQTPPGAQDDTGKAVLDIQLPLYVEAALPKLVPETPATDAYYFSLTQGKVLSRLNPEGGDALARFAQRVKSCFETGAFPVSPDVDGKACAYCDFDLLCRKGNRLANKTGEEAL